MFACPNRDCAVSRGSARFPARGTCPHCGTELVADAVCAAPLVAGTAEGASSAPDEWWVSLGEEAQLREPRVFSAWPFFIAQEYSRLHTLLRRGQAYGALLQLKDVFEVLLKYPTLLEACRIYRKRVRTDEENTMLAALMAKPLSLGDWVSIARGIPDHEGGDPAIAEALRIVARMFETSHLVSWRNETIGHGALRLDTDPGFRDDFRSKIEILGTLLRAMAACTDRMIVTAAAPDGSSHDLVGTDLPAGVNLASCRFTWRGTPIHPFFVTDESGLSFYDSYSARDEKTFLLNYLEGQRRKSRVPEIRDLYFGLGDQRTRRQIDGPGASALDAHVLLREDEEGLDRLLNVREFHEPAYLTGWLREQMSSHSKGVFLLQMEAGAGKSAFCRALDEQAMHGVPLEGTVSRGYYVNDVLLFRTHKFVEYLNDLFREDARSGRRITGGSAALPHLTRPPPEGRSQLAALLSFYAREHERLFGKRRLLFLLDGLDEIPSTDAPSIFEYIPRPEELADRVYVLLTARTDPELSSFCRAKLALLPVTGRLSVACADARNVQVLEDYARERLGIAEPARRSSFLASCGHRFLYAHALGALLESGPRGEIPPLSSGERILDYYFDRLLQMYGPKFYRNVAEASAVLATAFEPLTAREIAFLLGEEGLSPRLIALLIDLRGLTTVARSDRGNLLGIFHADLGKHIRARFQAEIRSACRRWAHLANDAPPEWTERPEDAPVYLAAYLWEHARLYAPDLVPVLRSGAFPGTAAAMAASLRSRSGGAHQVRRHIQIYEALADIARTSERPDRAGRLSEALRGSAELNLALGHNQRALVQFEEASALAVASGDWRALVHCLWGQAEIHIRQDEPAEASRVSLEAIRRLENAGDRDELIRACCSYAESLECLGRLGEALPFFRRAHDLSRASSSLVRRAYACAYYGYALGEYSGAPAGFDLLSEGLDFARASGDKEAVYYAARWLGMAFRSRGDLQKAFAYLTESASAAREMGILDISTLYELGVCHLDAQDLEEARQCFLRVLDMRDRYEEEHTTAFCRMQIAFVQARTGRTDGAAEACRQALEILRSGGSPLFRPEALLVAGRTFGILGLRDEARTCLNDGLALARSMGVNGAVRRLEAALAEFSQGADAPPAPDGDGGQGAAGGGGFVARR